MATLETDINTSHALISFRSIVAGLLIAFFTLAGFVGLGLAFGGMGLEDGSSAKAAGIFTGVWFIASALISIFVGSYFAARISKYRTARIGSAQGLVIAALFLGFFLYQILGAIGSAGSFAGAMVGKAANMVGSGVTTITQNPTIAGGLSNMTEDALGDLKLRSRPQVVASGLINRLVRGDMTGAKNYLAREANITPADADARISGIETKVNQALTDAREGAGVALRSTGISLFLLVLFGALAAIGGGAWGCSANFRKPFLREEYVGGHTVHA